ncbi:hypothetical protein GQX74_000162 [Glossina fuscipes]|nr:hypothetical protein GQX74_000162 [Glossina fuscipes]
MRNALDRGMLRTDLPSKYGNRVNTLNLCHEEIIHLIKCTMAVPLSEKDNLGGSAEIMFPPTTATSNENLLDIFNGNSSQLYKFNNSPDDLYKQATTISANGALVPPPYRDPPPPRNSPLQLNQQSHPQNLTAHLTPIPPKLQTLQYVEEENELVKQQEKTLKSEIVLLRSKLANCETELLQCKNKIRLLMDDIEIEQRSNCNENKRQIVERDLLMGMERI